MVMAEILNLLKMSSFTFQYIFINWSANQSAPILKMSVLETAKCAVISISLDFENGAEVNVPVLTFL